jgi:hypothetical protein
MNFYFLKNRIYKERYVNLFFLIRDGKYEYNVFN